jgi:cell division GTPase FtsZ
MKLDELMPEFKDNLFSDLGPSTNICAIGIGSAGAIIINQIYNEQLQNVTTISINTEQNNLSANYFFKLQNGTLGEYANAEGRVKIGEQLIDDLVNKNNFKEIIGKYDYIFLISALGGGLGTGGLLEMLNNLKDDDAYIVTISIIPFEFEKRNLKYLQEIKNRSGRMITVKNDDFINSPNDIFKDVLLRANDHVVELISRASNVLNELKNEQINNLFEDVSFEPSKALKLIAPQQNF